MVQNYSVAGPSPVTVTNGGTGDATLTAHGVLIGNGTGGVVASTAGTSGAILIAATGADPIFANLTPGTGLRAVGAANSLTLSTFGGGTNFIAPGGTSQAMAVNTSYLSNNGGLLTFTLPSVASSTAGDIVRVIGQGAGGWRIAQNALQVIVLNTASSTAGVTGHADSAAATNCVTLQCVDAGITWIATAIIGSPTVT